MPRKSKAAEQESLSEEPVHNPIEQPAKVEKKKRNVNPNTMTYIKALALYKSKTGHKGISPKKGTKEYDEIMKIMREHKGASGSVVTKVMGEHGVIWGKF